jgi:hypothetical protein
MSIVKQWLNKWFMSFLLKNFLSVSSFAILNNISSYVQSLI